MDLTDCRYSVEVTGMTALIKLEDNRIKLEQKPTRHNLLVYIE